MAERLLPECPQTENTATSSTAMPCTNFIVCTSCNEPVSQEEQRAHYRSDRHMYNVKRRVEGAAPISKDMWDRKLQKFAELRQENTKKKDHIKDKKKKNGNSVRNNSHNSQVTISEVTNSPTKGPLRRKSRTNSDMSRNSQTEEATIGDDKSIHSQQKPKKQPLSAEAQERREAVPVHFRCLFDNQYFEDLEANLDYMRRTYSFVIPDRQYCKKPEKLLTFLDKKIREGHQCLYCDRTFEGVRETMQHMLDKGHTRIGLEGYTRAGNYCPEATNELRLQLQDFYDFSESYKEINLSKINMQDKEILHLMDAEKGKKKEGEKMSKSDKLQELFSFFDEDKDGVLSFEEAVEWYDFLCEEFESSDDEAAEDESWSKPSKESQLTKQLYKDFSSNFNGKFNLDAMKQYYKLAERDIHEDYSRFLDEYDVIDDEVKNMSDFGDAEIIECSNEEEFQKIIAKYGLKKAKIVESTGNLQLPDGSEAGHRSLRYVYKQRGARKPGERKERLQLTGGWLGGDRTGTKNKKGESLTQMRMLQNGGDGDNQLKIAISRLKKDGKKIVAIMKQAQKKHMQRGVAQTMINRGRTITAMGYVR